MIAINTPSFDEPEKRNLETGVDFDVLNSNGEDNLEITYIGQLGLGGCRTIYRLVRREDSLYIAEVMIDENDLDEVNFASIQGKPDLNCLVWFHNPEKQIKNWGKIDRKLRGVGK
jgi:hypothetical protein